MYNMQYVIRRVAGDAGICNIYKSERNKRLVLRIYLNST